MERISRRPVLLVPAPPIDLECANALLHSMVYKEPEPEVLVVPELDFLGEGKFSCYLLLVYYVLCWSLISVYYLCLLSLLSLFVFACILSMSPDSVTSLLSLSSLLLLLPLMYLLFLALLPQLSPLFSLLHLLPLLPSLSSFFPLLPLLPPPARYKVICIILGSPCLLVFICV